MVNTSTVVQVILFLQGKLRHLPTSPTNHHYELYELFSIILHLQYNY